LGRSTAHYLIRTLDVPLLIAGQSPIPPTRVVAPLDPSAASQPTLKAAKQFAELLNAPLRVIHVVEPLPAPWLPVDGFTQDVVHERSREAFDRLMKSARTVAFADRVRRTGIAAEVIAEETAAWNAELIVVGAHGKGWVDRLLIGSTTERLVNLLPASLLVIPTAARRRSRL
jgi:universal stress protein A